MCTTKIVPVSFALILLLKTRLCMYQFHRDNKLDTIGQSKVIYVVKMSSRTTVRTAIAFIYLVKKFYGVSDHNATKREVVKNTCAERG